MSHFGSRMTSSAIFPSIYKSKHEWRSKEVFIMWEKVNYKRFFSSWVPAVWFMTKSTWFDYFLPGNRLCSQKDKYLRLTNPLAWPGGRLRLECTVPRRRAGNDAANYQFCVLGHDATIFDEVKLIFCTSRRKVPDSERKLKKLLSYLQNIGSVVTSPFKQSNAKLS